MLQIMVGPSASGKSTQAKWLLDSIGIDKAIIVSRDKIRETIFGYSPENVQEYYNRDDFGKLEQEVSRFQDKLIVAGLRANKTVIVDNTHLRMKYITPYHKYGVLVNYIPVEATLEQCLQRNSKRIRQVPEHILLKQYREFCDLKKVFDFKSYTPSEWRKPQYNPNLPDCYVFDIDGTLALHEGIRGPFDWSRVGEDFPNDDIVAIQTDLACIGVNNHDRLRIVICSGRDGICEFETEQWLKNHSILYDEFHMRPKGNQEPDYIIKERMWADISTRYNIVAMFDDRDQVVDHARRLGFTVCQVAYGDF